MPEESDSPREENPIQIEPHKARKIFPYFSLVRIINLIAPNHIPQATIYMLLITTQKKATIFIYKNNEMK